MSKLRILIAAALIVPFMAFGGLGAGAMPSEIATVQSDLGGAPSGQRCCWTFYMGHWYCVPC